MNYLQSLYIVDEYAHLENNSGEDKSARGQAHSVNIYLLGVF